MFFDFMNSQHPNIDFTFEGETAGKLSFLDVLIQRDGSNFSTSIFRKKTFTGLGMNYFSNLFYQYKISAVKTLIHRAYNLSSSYINFNSEVNFLKSYFKNNLFPLRLFYKLLNNFVCNLYENNQTMVMQPQRRDVFIGLPYIGQQTSNCRRELMELLSNFYPQLKIRFYYKNNFTIGSVLNSKNVTPMLLRSSVIYKYSCDCCTQFYIGSTKLQMFVRGSQHFGVSHRTNKPLTAPNASSIRDHAINSSHQLKFTNFTIIDSCRDVGNLRTLESMYIHRQRPQLNDMQSATELFIV